MQIKAIRRGFGALAALSLMTAACGSSGDDADSDAGSPDSAATAYATDDASSGTTAEESTAEESTAEESTAGETSAEEVTIDLLRSSGPTDTDLMETMTARYTELHPNVTFEIETFPGGEQGDNIVKTKLATGAVNDVFSYNSGSLRQRHPAGHRDRPIRQPCRGSRQDHHERTVRAP